VVVKEWVVEVEGVEEEIVDEAAVEDNSGMHVGGEVRAIRNRPPSRSRIVQHWLIFLRR